MAACSRLSIFRGLSVVLVLFALLGTWVALWQMNYHELYHGNNKCFSGNSIATYGGGDTYIYCPNSQIVSNINITALFFGGIQTRAYETGWDNFEEVGSKNWTSPTMSIYLDDDDEEIGWWFTMNKGSSINMSFTNVNVTSLMLQIDDEDTTFIEEGDSTRIFTTNDDVPSRGYRISFVSEDETLMGTNTGLVSFFYTQTLYDVVDMAPETCFGANLLTGCFWEFDYNSDFCIMQTNINEGRSWSADKSPVCTSVIQDGRDVAWTVFLICCSITILFLVIFCHIILYIAPDVIYAAKVVIARQIDSTRN